MPRRTRRLHLFVAATLLIALGGIAIDQLTLGRPDLGTSLLRYYWFRLSDVMLPLGTSLAVAQWIDRLEKRSSSAAIFWLLGALSLVAAHTADAFFRHRFDARPAAIRQSDPLSPLSQRRLRDWLNVCNWVAASTPAGEVLLTPRNQQTFKWYAERGEVVNWKDVPQDAAGIVEWDRRMRELYPRRVVMYGLIAHGQGRLLQLARKYGFRYVMLDRTRSARPLELQRVYPLAGRSIYEVYLLSGDALETAEELQSAP